MFRILKDVYDKVLNIQVSVVRLFVIRYLFLVSIFNRAINADCIEDFKVEIISIYFDECLTK